jgi:hypothetical protein
VEQEWLARSLNCAVVDVVDAGDDVLLLELRSPPSSRKNPSHSSIDTTETAARSKTRWEARYVPPEKHDDDSEAGGGMRAEMEVDGKEENGGGLRSSASFKRRNRRLALGSHDRSRNDPEINNNFFIPSFVIFSQIDI